MPLVSPAFARLTRAFKILAVRAALDAGRVNEAEALWAEAAASYIIDRATRTNPTEGSTTTDAHAPPPPSRRVDAE